MSKEKQDILAAVDNYLDDLDVPNTLGNVYWALNNILFYCIINDWFLVNETTCFNILELKNEIKIIISSN